MAVFYFAGHGIEVGGRNYLIPVDAELKTEADVEYEALSVNQVLDNMDLKQVRLKLLILDACRDNPFTRSWQRSSNEKGLAQFKIELLSKQASEFCQKAERGTSEAKGQNSANRKN